MMDRPFSDRDKESLVNKLHAEFDDLLSIKTAMMDQLSSTTLSAAHKKDLDQLKSLIKDSNHILQKYQQGQAKRIDVEKNYCAMINKVFQMSRRFHPLSSYGKEYLKQAYTIRCDFEQKIGLLISQVDIDNIEFFSSLMTSDLEEAIKIEKYDAIGAIRSSSRGLHGVGVLIYHLDENPKLQKPILQIKWLYVDEEWRNQGVGNALIGEIINAFSPEDFSAITIEIPEDRDAASLGEVLNKWHFKFTIGVTSEFVYQLSDVKTDKRKYKTTKVVSLSMYEKKDALSLIHLHFKYQGYQGHLLKHVEEDDFFEMDLSCFTGDPQNIRSMALVRRFPSGTLSIEYAFSQENASEDFPILLYELFLHAYKKYPPSTYVILSQLSKKMSNSLDRAFPKQKGMITLEGLLLPLPQELDIKKRDIKMMMDHSQEDDLD